MAHCFHCGGPGYEMVVVVVDVVVVDVVVVDVVLVVDVVGGSIQRSS